MRKTYKARSLAASPGLCPGLLAASNHLARNTHGFRRLAKIMRNLPEEQSRGIGSYTKRVIAVTKGIVLIFILGKLITKGRSGPSFVQVIRKMNEVLPLDCFFFFFKFILRKLNSPSALHSLVTSPPTGILLMSLLKRCQRTGYSFLILSAGKLSTSEFFQDFFFFLQGQKNLLKF